MLQLIQSFRKTISHLTGVALALLVYFSTDPTFINALSDHQKWWLHIIASGAVYLGVVGTPSGVAATAPKPEP